MKVLILGAGRVGGSLARALVNNNYDVSVVDTNKNILAALEDKLDILTVEGHASHPKSIKKAGADDSATVIAVTSDDEVNIIACQIAKNQFNVKKTICRLSDKSYTDNLNIFGSNVIDIVISPEKEVMNHLKELIIHPGTEQIEQFDDCKEIPLHFVGSIGFYLRDELKKVLDKNDLKLGKVLRRPIEGLVDYHLKNI